VKYRLDATVNWNDGTETTIQCHPNSLYHLKKAIANFVVTKDTTSFVFVVCRTQTGEEDE